MYVHVHICYTCTCTYMYNTYSTMYYFMTVIIAFIPLAVTIHFSCDCVASVAVVWKPENAVYCFV